jgi:hypothetical protein
MLGLGGRTGNMLMGAGIGAAAGIVGAMGADKVDFIKQHWYGEPAALGVGAFLLVRRKPTWAYALAGAAGYAGQFNYKLSQFQNGKSQTDPMATKQFGAGGATTTTKMLQNSGALEDATAF